MRNPEHQSCSTPEPLGPGFRPSDVTPEEAAVADRLGRLARVAAGPELEARIRDALAADAAPALRLRTGGARVPAWALAAAAAVLLAVGAVGLGLSSDGPTPEAAPTTAGTHASGSWLIEDPSLTLYHDLETFEGLGARPGDVLALGDDR